MPSQLHKNVSYLDYPVLCFVFAFEYQNTWRGARDEIFLSNCFLLLLSSQLEFRFRRLVFFVLCCSSSSAFGSRKHGVPDGAICDLSLSCANSTVGFLSRTFCDWADCFHSSRVWYLSGSFFFLMVQRWKSTALSSELIFDMCTWSIVFALSFFCLPFCADPFLDIALLSC